MDKLKKSNFFVFVSLIMILIFTCSACDFGGGGKKNDKFEEFTEKIRIIKSGYIKKSPWFLNLEFKGFFV